VHYTVEPDRAAAIRLALREAKAGDVVLIAGKGHEKEQIIGFTAIPFDDVKIALAALSEIGYGESNETYTCGSGHQHGRSAGSTFERAERRGNGRGRILD